MKTTAFPNSTTRVTSACRIVFATLAWVIAAGAMTQVFLVGLSLFQSATFWINHVDLGFMLALPALLLPVVAIPARPGRRWVITSIMITALYILQLTLSNLAIGYIAPFHALNAFVLIGTSVMLGVQAVGLLCSQSDDGKTSDVVVFVGGNG